ncbi:hypothetical protein [Flagellimonas sp.]|uniref:hypothetical protein n=1 Tax=Flagellimonas sp. TaxID=2058762 RepID=UPI003BB0889D
MLLQLNGNSTSGMYDYTTDLTIINDDLLSDIVSLKQGEIGEAELSLNSSIFLAHERQHFIDLNYSYYGLNKIIKYFRFKADFERDSTLLFVNPEFQTFINDLKQRKKLVQPIDDIGNPILFIGLETQSNMSFSKNSSGIWHFEHINTIIYERKAPEVEIAKMSLNEDSILELSALGAEYQHKLSVYGNHILDFEYEIFSLMHDFENSEYLSAFHIAHSSLRDGKYFDKPKSSNFPLTLSLLLGGLAARLAIAIVGTNSAKAINWHADFHRLCDLNNWKVEELSQHCFSKLECVFYNIILFAKETTSCMSFQEWTIDLLQLLGTNHLDLKSWIYDSTKHLISQMDKLIECDITKRRIQNSYNYLVRDFLSTEIRVKEFNFPNPCDSISWMNIFWQSGAPPKLIYNSKYHESYLNYVSGSLNFQIYISNLLNS